LSALECHALKDGRIIIYHRATNVERRFTLDQFKLVVTFLLEYYREGKTDLSPIVKTFPVNKKEFHEAPKDCTIEGVLALWTYRGELYKFVKKHNLFNIMYPNHWEGVIQTIRNRIEELRTTGGWTEKARLGWKVDSLLDEVLKAKTKRELLELLHDLITQYKEMINLIIRVVCPVIQSYFTKQNIYADYFRCSYCPFRVFHFRPERIEIRENLFEANLEELDFETLKQRTEAFVAIVKPVTKLHQLLKASNYSSWNQLKQAIPEMVEYEKDGYLERLFGGSQ